MKMKLFEPITIGNVTLKNHLVFASFETNYATEEGVVTQHQIDFYKRMAAGGVGLIVVQAANVNPKLAVRRTRFILGAYDDKLIPGLQKIVEAVHAEGCKVFVQLADKSLTARGVKPSDLPLSEIEDLIDTHVQGTVRAKKAGFDGVDYHMCHVTSVSDFLSMQSNKRTDEYGKGVEGRAKMAVEILRRSREKVGKDFLLAPRFGGDEFVVEGNTLEQTRVIAKLFEKAGADILDVSAGGRREDPKGDKAGEHAYSAHRSVPRAYMPDGVNVYIMEAIKREVNIPVIAVGKIRTAQLAEQILQGGKADLIAMGRQLFADHDFPRKVQEGRENEIVTCVSCRYCHRLYFADKPIECALRKKGSGEIKAEESIS